MPTKHRTLIMQRHDLIQSPPCCFIVAVIQRSSPIFSCLDKFSSLWMGWGESIHYASVIFYAMIYLRNNINMISWNLELPTLIWTQRNILCGPCFILKPFQSSLKKTLSLATNNFWFLRSVGPCGPHPTWSLSWLILRSK